jgi:hypothetical protein
MTTPLLAGAPSTHRLAVRTAASAVRSRAGSFPHSQNRHLPAPERLAGGAAFTVTQQGFVAAAISPGARAAADQQR